jgi:hypothetical protein
MAAAWWQLRCSPFQTHGRRYVVDWCLSIRNNSGKISKDDGRRRRRKLEDALEELENDEKEPLPVVTRLHWEEEEMKALITGLLGMQSTINDVFEDALIMSFVNK